MQAQVGDQIQILGTKVDLPVRDGEIIEVRGHNGTPPFVVKWSDTGHTALVFPGPDARIHHVHQQGGSG